MKHISLILIFLNLFAVYSQSTVTIFKTRPSEIELINYSKIKRSTVNNSSVDNLRINDKTEALLSKYGNLKVISPFADKAKWTNEKDSTLIIEFEIIKEYFTQNIKDRTTLIKQPSGDNQVHYYEASGELVLKFRLFDAKTNKLVSEKSYSASTSRKGSEEDWHDQAPRIDLTILSNQCVEEIGYAILKYVSNWSEKITLEFEDDNKFIEMPFVIKNINENNWEEALQILKKYSEDVNFKSKQKAKALYNYGLILLYDDQFDSAKEMFKQALLLYPKESIYESKYDLVEQEKKSKQILIDREIKREFELNKAKEEADKAKVELAKFNTINQELIVSREWDEEGNTPLTVYLFSFRNFILVDSIFGDCLDLECSSMTIFKVVNGARIEINTSQLFKNGGLDVEKLINSKAKTELKMFQDMNSEEYDERYENAIYQNHSFKGQYTDGFNTNKIGLYSLNSEENAFTFRTLVEYEEGETFRRDDGMLFCKFTLEELLPYFAE